MTLPWGAQLQFDSIMGCEWFVFCVGASSGLDVLIGPCAEGAQHIHSVLYFASLMLVI